MGEEKERNRGGGTCACAEMGGKKNFPLKETKMLDDRGLGRVCWEDGHQKPFNKIYMMGKICWVTSKPFHKTFHIFGPGTRRNWGLPVRTLQASVFYRETRSLIILDQPHWFKFSSNSSSCISGLVDRECVYNPPIYFEQVPILKFI